MNKKVVLLALFAILAIVTILATTVAVSYDVPLIKSIETNTDENFYCYANMSGVQPLGEDRGGGWP